MARPVTVVTTCGNEESRRGFTVYDNLREADKLFQTVKGLRPDLICLPEVFLETGRGEEKGGLSAAEAAGEALSFLSGAAKQLRTYVLAGTNEYVDGTIRNTAWLFDRSGTLQGRYVKHHPTLYEMEAGVVPGSEIPVFEVDFGTIGAAICFDLDWPDLWETLADRGAELVVWLSAYDGGLPLQAYAWRHFFYVVSSVRTNHSRIIDKTGRILASTSRWVSWVCRTIDLDTEVFHIDYQYDRLASVQAELGSRVTIESFSEENVFTLTANDPEWPLAEIIARFGLETYRDYHRRSEAKQNDLRGK